MHDEIAYVSIVYGLIVYVSIVYGSIVYGSITNANKSENLKFLKSFFSNELNAPVNICAVVSKDEIEIGVEGWWVGEVSLNPLPPSL